MTNRDLSKSGGGDVPVLIGTFAIGDLPTAATALTGAMAVRAARNIVFAFVIGPSCP